MEARKRKATDPPTAGLRTRPVARLAKEAAPEPGPPCELRTVPDPPQRALEYIPLAAPVQDMLTRPVSVASEIPSLAVLEQHRPPACHDFPKRSRNCGIALPMPDAFPGRRQDSGSNDGLAAPWAGTACGYAGTPACRLACCAHRVPETPGGCHPRLNPAQQACCRTRSVTRRFPAPEAYAANLRPRSSLPPGLNGASSRVPPAPAAFTCPNTGPGSPP